jgi:hypothetical protein
MTYYLYKKTHTKTNLQYLGFTKHNPYRYKGSGKYWCLHIDKHGNDVQTEILFETESKQKIQELGSYYSILWNIVNSPDWANLKPESGDGGGVTGMNKGKQRPKEHIEAMRAGWERKKQKGYIPHNKGKKYGPSAKAISCVFISPTGEEFSYPSFRQGCLAHNLPVSMISKVKNRKLSHCRGWKVKENQNY